MPHVALFEPEIPPNTGNIIRLCANTGFQLHLIEPMGFKPNDTKLKRAGLDYHEFARVQIHPDYSAFLESVQGSRIFACSTHGKQNYAEVQYQENDVFLLGPESRGLPVWLRESLPPEQVIRIPMMPNSRSLNLSNAAAVMVYECWRQLGFQSWS